MTLTEFVQVITILGFIGGAIMLFVKAGELKTTTTKDIEQIKEDVRELQKKEKDQDSRINEIKDKNDIAINRVEGLLIELKTKLEIFMQNGFNHEEH